MTSLDMCSCTLRLLISNQKMILGTNNAIMKKLHITKTHHRNTKQYKHTWLLITFWSSALVTNCLNVGWNYYCVTISQCSSVLVHCLAHLLLHSCQTHGCVLAAKKTGHLTQVCYLREEQFSLFQPIVALKLLG